MQFHLPELGEGVYECEFVEWLVQPGDYVKSGQTLGEVMTDKATMELPSPFAGRVQALHAEPGQQLKIGQAILDYTPADDLNGAPQHSGSETSAERELATAAAESAAPRAAASQAPRVSAFPRSASVPAAPSVRRMARQLGVDLARVHGSGPGGRVLLDDLALAVRQGNGSQVVHKKTRLQFDFGKPGQRIPLRGLRKTIAERMVHSQHIAPHYSYVDECDLTELVRLRDSLKAAYAKRGVRLTYLAFVVKAVVQALKNIPIVNASLDDEAGQIVLHDRYHVGMAAATPQGLMVPVIRDADRLDLGQIAAEIERLTAAARDGTAKREELVGGTFTITSIGSIGGLIATPILNHPEVGILAVGKIARRPVYDSRGELRPAEMCYLSFTFDHRVVDGAVCAEFSNAVIRRLQDPAELLLGE
jgi:pyruvate/2-oxoglutarate dehydrogenase complex dihydrolipoamide acyltransferase (E2) component